MKNKILSIILALTLALTLAPAAVMADTATETNCFYGAVASISNATSIAALPLSNLFDSNISAQSAHRPVSITGDYTLTITMTNAVNLDKITFVEQFNPGLLGTGITSSQSVIKSIVVKDAFGTETTVKENYALTSSTGVNQVATNVVEFSPAVGNVVVITFDNSSPSPYLFQEIIGHNAGLTNILTNSDVTIKTEGGTISNASFPATKMIDGLVNDASEAPYNRCAWAAGADGKFTVTLDLGRTYNLDAFEVVERYVNSTKSCGEETTVYLGKKENGQVVYEATKSAFALNAGTDGAAVRTLVSFGGVKEADVIKVVFQEKDTDGFDGGGIFELIAYGEATSTANVFSDNLAYIKPNLTSVAALPSTKMVDGLFGNDNVTSRYVAATATTEPLVVEIAISNPHEINKIDIVEYYNTHYTQTTTTCSDNVKIECGVSNGSGGFTYTTVKEGVSMQNRDTSYSTVIPAGSDRKHLPVHNVFTFNATKADAVRITFANTGTATSYPIYEIMGYGAETEIYRVSNLAYLQNGETAEALPENGEFTVNVTYGDVANATGTKSIVAVYDAAGGLIQAVQGNPADNFNFNVGSDKTISNIRVFTFTNMTTLVPACIRYSYTRPAVTE